MAEEGTTFSHLPRGGKCGGVKLAAVFCGMIHAASDLEKAAERHACPNAISISAFADMKRARRARVRYRALCVEASKQS